MKYNEFYKQYEEIKRKTELIQNFAEKILGKGYRENASIEEINENGILCEFEMRYCGCCEGDHISYLILPEWIDTIAFDENGDYDTKELEALLITYKEKLVEIEKEKKEAEEREIKNKKIFLARKREVEELEEYNRLKEKFEKKG